MALNIGEEGLLLNVECWWILSTERGFDSKLLLGEKMLNLDYR
jgi:hypothetical protein